MSLLQQMQLARDPDVTVANLVDELLRRKGDYEVGVEDSLTGAVAWRLADLHKDLCSIDAFLRQRVGLKPGTPVAVYRTNDRRYFRWFLAIIRAGGIAVPLNPQLSLTEVRRILSDSGTHILVTDTAVFNHTIHTRESLSVTTWIQSDDAPETIEGCLRPSSRNEDSFPPSVVDPSATIAIFHTSGTSGFPKGAALSSRALLGARSSTIFVGLALGPRDLALVALPWSHIMAVSIALYGLMAGIRGCFLERFDVQRAVSLIERYRITAVVGVPAMFARIVAIQPKPAQLSSVRVWLSASDHLPTAVRQQLRRYGAFLRLPRGRQIPPVLLNGYGMVELGGLAMMGIELSFIPGSGDLCFPVPPFRVRVADANGNAVPAGAVGECQIQRSGLKPHYWKDTPAKPSQDDLLTSDAWLRTGDLATRNRFGLIRLVGRIKDVIKSGGYSVYVRELEEAILTHPAVARAAAFGLPHAEKGEQPAAAVELNDGLSITSNELQEWCRQHLAGYKCPRQIWILESGTMPQNHNGKVVRQVLRDRFSAEAEQAN